MLAFEFNRLCIQLLTGLSVKLCLTETSLYLQPIIPRHMHAVTLLDLM